MVRNLNQVLLPGGLAGDGLSGIRLGPFALDGVVDFLAMDGYFLGGINTQADFVAADIDNRNDDVIANNDALIALS